MSVVLLGSTSGSVTLQEPAVAGSTTINLPATSGTMAVLPTATSVLPEASGGTGTTTGYYGFKNRIINGAMVIDQRNAGASATPVDGAYTLDRWKTFVSQASKLTIQQNAGSVTPPVGYSKYLGITVGASANVTVGASDYFAIVQIIEGQNVADMAWGTASAATITISFWVRSSLTGTFGGAFRNSTANRSYPFTYTISAANTWEQKSITIAGDTSGTWLTTNSAGALLEFALGAGSTYSGTAGVWAGASYESATGAVKLIETNSATFYITGVQLEKGSTATSFDYRPYGTELALCQRYYYRISAAGANFTEYGTGYINTTSTAQVLTIFPVTMRTAPSAVDQSGTAANYGVLNLNVSTTSTSVPTFSYASVAAARTVFTTAATLVAGQGCMGRSESTAAYLGWSAEL